MNNKNFPELSLEWFYDNCLAGIDPIKAHDNWDKWIKRANLSDETKYRKALRLASGFPEAVIRQYLKNLPKHLSVKRLQALDHISRSLDRIPPEDRQQTLRYGSELALLIDMDRIVSPSYYMEIIKELVEEAMKHHLSFNIYKVSQNDHESLIKRISHVYYPIGFVMVRLNPSNECCRILERDNVPVVLIHGDRTYKSPPVLANIVPDQSEIPNDIEKWFEKIKEESSKWNDKFNNDIVLVAMPNEPDDSIRNERIESIRKAINEYIKLYTVQDYSFRHAMNIYQKYPDAMGYICLSDEIAVGIKHLMERDKKDYKYRITGFDNSQLARIEEIISFDQGLGKIGRAVIETFLDWFEKFSWPKSTKKIPLDVKLVYPEDRMEKY